MIYRLEREQRIPAPIDVVFDYFRDPRNLAELTPPWLGFRFRREPPAHTGKDMVFEYWIGLGGIPLPWRTRITQWDPPHGFVDEQERGPYALWRHQHLFEPVGDHVWMADRVDYALPLGPLGRAAHGVAIHSLLARIFDYRFGRVRERFRTGGAEGPGPA